MGAVPGDDGQFSFSLQKDQAAVCLTAWTTCDEHGKLMAEAVHAAGTVFSGTKPVAAVMWALQDFKRPATSSEEQARPPHRSGCARPCREKPPYITYTC
jgi:hypothetical protein